MKVLYITSEIYPLNKTGGLGDVSAFLPPALKKTGIDVRLLMPGFPAILKDLKNEKEVAQFSDKFGAQTIRLLYGTLQTNNLPIYVIDAPELYLRGGNPYLDSSGKEWGDNFLRFALFGWVGAQFAHKKYLPHWTPDVIHAHDWHTGLLPAYVKTMNLKKRSTIIFTVHNLAFQGLFPRDVFPFLDLPESYYSPEGIEFHGKISFMKSGLYYADKITTVSNRYAEEIQDYEQGFGYEGLLSYRKNNLTGILNGADYTVWNPQKIL